MSDMGLIKVLNDRTGLGMFECKRILKSCNWDLYDALYYVDHGKLPYYYVIYKNSYPLGSGPDDVLCIVTDEDVAKDFCYRYKDWYHYEVNKIEDDSYNMIIKGDKNESK